MTNMNWLDAFNDWVRANYTGYERQEVFDHFTQSGAYPEDFVEYMNAGSSHE